MILSMVHAVLKKLTHYMLNLQLCFAHVLFMFAICCSLPIMCCSHLLYVACICSMLLKFAMCTHHVHVLFMFCHIRCSLLIMCCLCLLCIALCLLKLNLYIAHCPCIMCWSCLLQASLCLIMCCLHLYIAHCSSCVVMSITTIHYN